ncbi:MAG: hypothetical protein ABWZ65_23210 [Pseudomonas mandelii]
MSNTTMNFEIPFLKNTQSPNHVTKAEFDSSKVAVVAKFKVELNDQVTFHISGPNGIKYSREANASPGGVSNGEVGVKLDDVQDHQLIGTKAVVYYTVRRNNIEQGRSAEFQFSVAAS